MILPENMRNVAIVYKKGYSNGLEQGQNEVQRLVKKVVNLSVNEMIDIFGTDYIPEILINNLYQKAKEKIDKYFEEKKANEFEIGDIVINQRQNIKYVIIEKGIVTWTLVGFKNAIYVHNDSLKNGYKKTGVNVAEQLDIIKEKMKEAAE